MILQWQSKPRPYNLVWKGPTVVETAISTMEEVEAKVAVIFGPRGLKGDKGDPGTVTGELPAVLDGGNF